MLDEYADALADLQRRAASARDEAESDYAPIQTRRSIALNASSEFVVGWTLEWDDVLPSWLYLDDPSLLDRWQPRRSTTSAARAPSCNALQRRTRPARPATPPLGWPASRSSQRSPTTVSYGAAGFVAATALWAGDHGRRHSRADRRARGPRAHPAGLGQRWTRAEKEALIAASAATSSAISTASRSVTACAANRLNIEDEIAAPRGGRSTRWNGCATPRTRKQLATTARRQADRQASTTLRSRRAAAPDRLPTAVCSTAARPDRTTRAGRAHTRPARASSSSTRRTEAIATYHGAIDPGDRRHPVVGALHVAISVPGTVRDHHRLRRRPRRRPSIRRRPRSAVFQWAGGRSPAIHRRGDEQSYSPTSSRRGCATSPRASPSRRARRCTMLGHSYGERLVGLAEAGGTACRPGALRRRSGHRARCRGQWTIFPHTSDVPHYAMMVPQRPGRSGSSRAARRPARPPRSVDARPPRASSASRRLTRRRGRRQRRHRGLQRARQRDAAAIDSHSSLFTRGIDARSRTWSPVITGGQAEAVRRRTRSSSRAAARSSIDGIDRADYDPVYTRGRAEPCADSSPPSRVALSRSLLGGCSMDTPEPARRDTRTEAGPAIAEDVLALISGRPRSRHPASPSPSSGYAPTEAGQRPASIRPGGQACESLRTPRRRRRMPRPTRPPRSRTGSPRDGWRRVEGARDRGRRAHHRRVPSGPRRRATGTSR